jgi:hypothetical protein
MMQWLRDHLSPENRRTIGEEAKQALQNPHWKEAFEAVEGYLIGKAKSIDPVDKERTQDVVRCLQLLESIKRELVRKVEDGEVAQIEIAELERRKPLRFVR